MFTLTDEQVTRFNAWCVALDARHGPQYSGAAGGRFTYAFTPNGLGLCVEVIDNITQEKLELTDFSDW